VKPRLIVEKRGGGKLPRRKGTSCLGRFVAEGDFLSDAHTPNLLGRGNGLSNLRQRRRGKGLWEKGYGQRVGLT